jgi:hypothetical protein
MASQLFNELKEAIASSSRKPLIVCGAGVSVNATRGAAPSWAQLLESGIDRVAELDLDDGTWAAYARSRLKKGKAANWIDVADEITERLGGSGNAEFALWLRTNVGHLKVEDRELIESIKELRCPIATTNYDDVLAAGLNRLPHYME